MNIANAESPNIPCLLPKSGEASFLGNENGARANPLVTVVVVFAGAMLLTICSAGELFAAAAPVPAVRTFEVAADCFRRLIKRSDRSE